MLLKIIHIYSICNKLHECQVITTLAMETYFFSTNLCSRTSSEKYLPCLFCNVDLFSGKLWMAS